MVMVTWKTERDREKEGERERDGGMNGDGRVVEDITNRTDANSWKRSNLISIPTNPFSMKCNLIGLMAFLLITLWTTTTASLVAWLPPMSSLETIQKKMRGWESSHLTLIYYFCKYNVMFDQTSTMKNPTHK